jgi:hypothetical protein
VGIELGAQLRGCQPVAARSLDDGESQVSDEVEAVAQVCVELFIT